MCHHQHHPTAQNHKCSWWNCDQSRSHFSATNPNLHPEHIHQRLLITSYHSNTTLESIYKQKGAYMLLPAPPKGSKIRAHMARPSIKTAPTFQPHGLKFHHNICWKGPILSRDTLSPLNRDYRSGRRLNTATSFQPVHCCSLEVLSHNHFSNINCGQRNPSVNAHWLYHHISSVRENKDMGCSLLWPLAGAGRMKVIKI